MPTLIATLTIQSMETKQIPRLIDVIKYPLRHYKYQATPLNGIITLKKNALIGYGSTGCIKALKKANIQVEQQWPLVPIDVFIPNPKAHDNDKQIYTNWTLQTPPVIKKEINNLIDAEINKEQQRLAERCGYIITLQNQEAWQQFRAIADRIRKCTQNTKPLLLPALIPVHILMSPAIQLNLFNCCQTALTFDEYEMLEKLMEQFYHAPQVSFTMLGAKTIRNIKFLELLQQQNSNYTALNAECLEQKIITQCITQTNATNTELENKNILEKPFSWNEPTDLYIIDITIGVAIIDESHAHGENGCSRDAFRNLLLKNELKGQNPVTFINKRAING